MSAQPAKDMKDASSREQPAELARQIAAAQEVLREQAAALRALAKK